MPCRKGFAWRMTCAKSSSSGRSAHKQADSAVYTDQREHARVGMRYSKDARKVKSQCGGASGFKLALWSCIEHLKKETHTQYQALLHALYQRRVQLRPAT